MSLRLPALAWEHLQAFIAAHPTCQVTLHLHQGKVCKVDMQETLKVYEGTKETLDKSVLCATE